MMTIILFIELFLLGFFVVIAWHCRVAWVYWRRKSKQQTAVILQMQQIAVLTEEQTKLIEELNRGA